MNYRHGYHAGNFADAMKHAFLARLIERLKLKPAPFRVIDTHAGAGLHDLDAPEARRTAEADGGVERLLEDPVEGEAGRLLAPYLDAVRALRAGGRRLYPGSPRLALALLRPCDRLTAIEAHPEEARRLRAALAGDRRADPREGDGWALWPALVPPPERRGLVLVDPPFEAPDEFARLARGLAEGLRRWAGGTQALWYPIKDAAVADRLANAARAVAPRLLRLELLVEAPDGRRLAGSGLLVANPPYGLAEEADALLPALAARLGRGPGAGWRAERLGD